MTKLQAAENAYYQERYENNGFTITNGPSSGYLIWKNREVVRTAETLVEAEAMTTDPKLLDPEAAIYYVAEKYSRARNTWTGISLQQKTWFSGELGAALAAFFLEAARKPGEYRLQRVTRFESGGKKHKTVCSVGLAEVPG